MLPLFMSPSSPFWFSKFQLCCKRKRKEKAVNEASGWKLSRKKSNFCLVLCISKWKCYMLIKLPIKQTILGNKKGFRKQAGRRRGRSERRNKMRVLFLEETAKVQPMARKCLNTFHSSGAVHHFNADNKQ